MLLNTCVVRTKTHADALVRGIEAGLGKGVISPFQNLNPFIVILGKCELVLNLQVQLGRAAVAPNAVNDDIIEGITKRGALALHARCELAGQSAYGGLA